jgi:isocitrate dehydrogenase (NAD+)
MLEHCKLPDLATRLRSAIGAALNADNVRTGDLGGSAGTRQFAKAVASRIANG